MKSYQKVIAYSSIIAAGLLGCDETQQKKTPPEPPKYFASVPMSPDSGMALTTGDFDGDGDLDLIVGARNYTYGNNSGRLYHYVNDGKGNFALKEPNRK